MPEPWEWSEDDLLQLITDQVQESLTLDYKAAPALEKTDQRKDELSKDVSAFANSAGGTLVYGMRESGHLPANLDTGYDPADITREWLEQVINSRIQRRIEGIRINQVSLAKTHPGRVAYVVSIPQSLRAPHMASDKRYYGRFDFQSVPMEEYEVRDVGYRRTGPDLSLGVRPGDGGELEFGAASGLSEVIAIEVLVTNASPTPAEFALVRLYLDARITISTEGGWHMNPVHPTFQAADVGRQMNALDFNWSVNDRLPIWEGMMLTAAPPPRVQFPGDGVYLYGWEIFSPQMMARRMLVGEIRVANGMAITVEPAPADVD